jgi:voltage-gated potassium channel
MIASILMLLGYAIIAVPTGIVTASFSEMKKQNKWSKECPKCGLSIKNEKANYCEFCGTDLRDMG